VLAAMANWLCSAFQTFHLRIRHEQPIRHALVEILDIRINIGNLLTDYAAPHRRRRLLESRCRARRTSRVAEHKLAYVKALSVKVRSFRHTSSGRRR
jgi:hypothetical protein